MFFVHARARTKPLLPTTQCPLRPNNVSTAHKRRTHVARENSSQLATRSPPQRAVKPFMHSGVCIIGSLAIFKRVCEGRAAIVDAHTGRRKARARQQAHVRIVCRVSSCFVADAHACATQNAVRQEFHCACERARPGESNRMNNILRIHHMVRSGACVWLWRVDGRRSVDHHGCGALALLRVCRTRTHGCHIQLLYLRFIS